MRDTGERLEHAFASGVMEGDAQAREEALCEAPLDLTEAPSSDVEKTTTKATRRRSAKQGVTRPEERARCLGGACPNHITHERGTPIDRLEPRALVPGAAARRGCFRPGSQAPAGPANLVTSSVGTLENTNS